VPIGVNFVAGRSADGGDGSGGGSGELVLPGDTAGVFAQMNWNNALGSNSAGPAPATGALSLMNAAGSPTGATASWSGVPNSWTISGSAAADGNGRLMNGYLDTNNSTGSTTITVDNVPFNRYDVYIYKDGDAGSGRSGDYTVNGVTQTDLQEPANWPVTTAGGGTFAQATTGNPGNFALFQSVSGSTLTVNANESASGGGTRAPVNGLQIVEIGGYANRVLDDGPIAYYRFQETGGTIAFDSVGTNHGTHIGGADVTAAGPRPPMHPGFSEINAATGFDGIDDAVNTPVSLSNAQQFTVSGWVNADTITQAARSGLFGQNDVVEFGYIDDATIELWTPASGANQVPAPADAQWYHIAAVGAGRTTQVYINGQLAGLTAHGALGAVGYGASADLINIGGDGIQDGAGNFFVGAIDDVAVYDRALSQAEIRRQINAAAGVADPVFEGFSASFIGGQGGGGNSGNRTVDGPAGFVELDNWNNLANASGTEMSLTRSDGSTASVMVEWSSPNSWTTAAIDDGANGSLYRGYLDSNDQGVAGGPMISITGLPEEFADGYDVIVYFDGNDGTDRFGDYTVDDGIVSITQIGNDTLPGDVHSAMFQGFFLDGGGATDGGNFLLFEDLTGLDLTISSAAFPTADGGGFRAPISGFQILRQLQEPVIPEPATATLGLMSLAALAWRRRRRA
jgi:hypothetical protein